MVGETVATIGNVINKKKVCRATTATEIKIWARQSTARVYVSVGFPMCEYVTDRWVQIIEYRISYLNSNNNY